MQCALCWFCACACACAAALCADVLYGLVQDLDVMCPLRELGRDAHARIVAQVFLPLRSGWQWSKLELSCLLHSACIIHLASTHALRIHCLHSLASEELEVEVEPTHNRASLSYPPVPCQLLSLMDGAKEEAASVMVAATACKPNNIGA